jgi:sugar phosphate isomerase/epimerase
VNPDLSRRQWLAGTSAAVGTLMATRPTVHAQSNTQKRAAEPFGYCLNTSTISGQKLSLVDEVEIAAKAGYQAIEPWIRELDQHVKEGGSLRDLAARIRDRGLSVPSAIGFFEWIVDDDVRRKKAFEEAKRNMDLVRQIGGKRLAAPPLGATNRAGLDLLKAAQRYRELLELGAQMGVVPQVELWGSSRNLSRLGETALVAIESGRPDASMLLDVYHLYKGGSDINGLRLLAGSAMHVLHCNDYPASPPRASIVDANRIYPGDGIAPWKMILRTLRDIDYRGMLSLELFNREYWKQDASTVARTGLEKMRAIVRNSLADVD